MNSPILTKCQLLIFGFYRNVKKDETYTPIEIVNMINDYYPSIAVYGIGKNDMGELAVGNNKPVKQFRKLKEMSALCDFPQNLYGNMCRFVVFKKLLNEIYLVGDTHDGERMSRVDENHVIKFGKMEKINNEYDDDTDIALISTGFSANFGLCMTKKNNLYSFGPNSYSDGSDFEVIRSDDKSNIFKNLDVKSVNVGYGHVMYLMCDGSVYGSAVYGNNYGQIGIKKDAYNPQKIDALSGYHIIQIECGTDHTICLDDNYTVIVFGKNDVGQLGLGHNEKVEDEITVNNYFKDKYIDQVKTGGDHSICIGNNGDGYIFGDNQFGQIGNRKSGQNTFQTYPYLLPLQNIITGSVSDNHTIILTEGDVFTFGGNDFNQCSAYIFHEEVIDTPYLLTKQEIGMEKSDKIVNVIAGDSVSVLVVNEC